MARPKRPARPAADQAQRVVGYVRVSTAEQETSGAGLDAQRAAIEAEVARRGWTLIRIAADTCSGRKAAGDRPGLGSALADLAAARADVLMASKLDRVSRSAVDFGRTLERARREGWSVVVLDLGLDMTTAVGEMVAGIVAQVAQFEARRISERTKEALAARKAAGVRVGRERVMDPRTRGRILRERKAGRSLPQIAEGLNRDGVRTAHGGVKWWASAIRAVVISEERA